MRRIAVCFSVIFIFFFSRPLWALPAKIHFTAGDRVLVVAPHPDDEALGTGGVIQSALKAGAEVKVLYLTHGDLNEIASFFYLRKPMVVPADFVKSGRIRKKEAIRAMSVLGLDSNHLLFLGYPDFGTLAVWRRYWGKVKPFRNFFTRLHKVAYEDDFSYGNYFTGDFIAGDFEKVIRSFRPTFIFATCPFDLNSDHRAAYLYLNLALLNIRGEDPAPKVYLYLIHTHHWPQPRRYLPKGVLEAPRRAPWSEELWWTSFSVDPAMEKTKKEAILQYKSQIAYSKDFMLSFARSNELFMQLPPEELVSEEAAGNTAPRPVGAENEVSYFLKNKELWVDVNLSKPLEEIGAVSIEIFGYKKETPFGNMPKLQLMFYDEKLSVRDGNRNVRGWDLPFEAKGRRASVGIPLAFLKNPEYVFVSMHAGGDQTSTRFGFWKILKLPERAAGGHATGDKI